MDNNNTLEEIGKVLLKAESVCIFPHVNADGDALGSSIGLCSALRKAGKEAFVLLEEPLPKYLGFIDPDGCSTQDVNVITNPDVCVCVDCGDANRFPLRKETFEKGKIKICVDHHGTSKPFADYNHIEPEAAATGELVYEIIKEMGVAFDKKIGTAIYTAILTDTGSFRYSNTRKESFLIAADLMNYGIDVNEISNEIYQNAPLPKILITGRVLDTMEVFADGTAAIACVTQKDLEETGGEMEHTEGAVDLLRSISGVEVATLLKEQPNKTVKVSMRAKKYADVSVICQKYGGGGHIRASGCTMNMAVKEAMKQMKADIEEAYKKGYK